MNRIKRVKQIRQNIPLLIMFVPVLAYYIIFKYVPMGGLIIAFKDYNFTDGLYRSAWVGTDNFATLFRSPLSLNIIRNTLMLSVLGLLAGFPFPIALAIMLNEVRMMLFKKMAQTLLYMPHFFSWVIVGGLVVTLFGQNGTLNQWLQQQIGVTIPFLYAELPWISIFIGSGIWKGAGFGAIIYLAALTAIDPSLYESAAIDGAGKWKQIRHITLPGISNTIVLMLILSVGNIMEVGFDPVYVLQNPVVSNVADVISTYIYRVGLQGGQFSLTTAMGLFESLVGFILVMIANRIARYYDKALW